VFPDLRTIVLVLVITTCIAAIALFLFYRLIKEINGMQYAAIGGGCQALGSVFLLLRDSIEPMVSVISFLLSGCQITDRFKNELGDSINANRCFVPAVYVVPWQ
jgi:hypothetical protein